VEAVKHGSVAFFGSTRPARAAIFPATERAGVPMGQPRRADVADPIRCSVDLSQAQHTVNCEPVAIGPEAGSSPAPARAPHAETPVPPLPPAVRALVQSQSPLQHGVQAAQVEVITWGGAMQCLGQINAMTLLLLGVKGPVLGSAAAFKVGYDLGACIAKDKNTRQLSADQAAAVSECIDHAGTPTGEIGHTLICERAGSR
jgi:hypothetical protein